MGFMNICFNFPYKNVAPCSAVELSDIVLTPQGRGAKGRTGYPGENCTREESPPKTYEYHMN